MANGLIHRATWRTAVLVLLETALIVCAVYAGAWIRLGAASLGMMTEATFSLKALLVALVLQLCFYYCDLYDDVRIAADHRELLIRIFQALGATSIILSLVYYLFPDLVLGRGVVGVAASFIVAGVVGWRMAFPWLASRVGRQERLLLVGTSEAGVALARELHQRADLGVEIVGFIDVDPTKVGLPMFNPAIVGTIDDIPRIVEDLGVHKVVVSMTDARGLLPMMKLLELRTAGITFEHLATVYEHYTGKIAVENLRPSWLIFRSGFDKSPWREAVKRGIDVAAAAAGMALTAPIVLAFAVAVRLTSPGPAFYSQRRVGLQGRPFMVHKLRSMRADAEAATGAVWSRPNDARVTPIGSFMRRSRIDELPQLWNVLRGDMSLVGPRPERPEFVAELEQQIPLYGQRHIIKPGLTGWAQVRYSYGATVEDALEKLQYDLYYIKNYSLSLDFFILFETVKTVILRKGL